MKHKIALPGWLLIAAMATFSEVMVHLWISEPFAFGTFLQVLLFGLGFGGLLGFLVSFLPGKIQKLASCILSVLLVTLFLTQYFVNDAYMVFMPLSGILDGAGGVMSDFGDVVAVLLLRDWWRIVLMLLPIILFALFAAPTKCRWTLRSALAVGSLLFYFAGFGAVYALAADAPKLNDQYNFDSAVRSFGLTMALSLDLFREEGITGEDDFIIPETTHPTEAAETTEEPVTEPEGEETVPESQPVVYGQNVMNVDFAELAQKEKNSSIASVHKYVASQTPTSKNKFTGLFKGKNLIFITAEAFSAEVIDPERTPTLYRLATRGIRFTDYYQPVWGGSTSTGEYSNLIGLVAADASKSIQESLQQDLFLTIGNQLQDLGYFSAAYHNHSYTYYDRNKTHPKLGYATFMGMGNGMEKGVKKQWPESDLEMMQFTVDQYIDKQPFSIYYMTVSGHTNYNVGGNAMCRKNHDLMAGLDASEKIKCYYAAQQELEFALSYLVQRLEEAGIANDTVIVLATDHYPYALEKGSTWGNTENYLRELYGYSCSNEADRDHSALIIWSGCIDDLCLSVDTPVYSLDILPTLSNLFGVVYDSRLLIGRDVFSDAEPLVLWNNYSWKTDKGSYMNGKFTAAEGAEIEDGYADRISAIVKNKISYSKSVAKHNYFNYVAEYHMPLGVG